LSLFILAKYEKKMKNKSFEYWSKQELEALPQRKWDEDIGVFDSLIILPTTHSHDKGFKCMTFVVVKGKEPYCRLSGYSDIIHLDGVGGYGKRETVNALLIPPKGWCIDCLESGLIRIFSKRKLKSGAVLPWFELFTSIVPNYTEPYHNTNK